MKRWEEERTKGSGVGGRQSRHPGDLRASSRALVPQWGIPVRRDLAPVLRRITCRENNQTGNLKQGLRVGEEKTVCI